LARDGLDLTQGRLNSTQGGSYPTQPDVDPA